MKKYIFKKPLIEGLIKSRPNRFIMIVEINGELEKCHCPSTGRIGDVVFKDIPCLVSLAENTDRKTKYSVEAISLDSIDKKDKNWIGINQTKVNAYVEFFLREGMLDRILGKIKEVKREVSLGKSRLDFLINNKDYIEVKTPLIEFLLKTKSTYPHLEKESEFNSFDRLIKHFKDIAKSIKHGSRAILLMCYVYDAKKFEIPPIEDSNLKIVRAANLAHSRGVENWQVNLKIDKEGVSLLDYFPLKLFSKV